VDSSRRLLLRRSRPADTAALGEMCRKFSCDRTAGLQKLRNLRRFTGEQEQPFADVIGFLRLID
jgi:hypothetical protein